MELNLDEENEAALQVVNIQIMDLEAHLVSVKLIGGHLYVANTVESYALPSTVAQLSKQSHTVIDYLSDFKVKNKKNEYDESI